MKRAALAFRNEKKAGPYRDALLDAGSEPIAVTPNSGSLSLVGLGLVLTGGTDVDPSFYGQDLDPLADKPDRERDVLEQRLLSEALALDVPRVISRTVRSWTTLTGTVCQAIRMPVSLDGEPTQLNRVGSKFAPLTPCSGAKAIELLGARMTVPSFSAPA